MSFNLARIATILFYSGGGLGIYYLNKLSKTKMGVMRYLYGMREVYTKEVFTQNVIEYIIIGLFSLIALSAITLTFKVITSKKVSLYSPLLLLINSTATVCFVMSPICKDWLVYYCALIFLLIGVSIQTLWFIIYAFRGNTNRA